MFRSLNTRVEKKKLIKLKENKKNLTSYKEDKNCRRSKEKECKLASNVEHEGLGLRRAGTT